MADKRFVEKLEAALARDAARSTRDRWNELVARGAIDSKGHVLVRGPQNGPASASGPKRGGPPKKAK